MSIQESHADVEQSGRVASLWEMADLATPMAVRVAATLRIADHIERGARSAPQLARAVHADEPALDSLLRYLAAIGLLHRDESDEYTLTAWGGQLRDDHPDGMRERLDMEETYGRADLAFVQLLHSVRTGEAAYPAHFGCTFWDDLSSDRRRSGAFNSRMGTDVGAQMSPITSAYDWGSLGHVVDVGGGNGSLVIALLRRYPTLRGTVVDLPVVAEQARQALAAAGLADRGDVRPGSFFDPLPPGAGGYLISAVIHNWDDASARTILRRCAEAAGTTGAVFIVERMVGDGDFLLADMAMRLLVWYGGRIRDVAQLGALAAEVGLRVDTTFGAGPMRITRLAAC